MAIRKASIYSTTQIGDATGKVNNPEIFVEYKGYETATAKTTVDQASRLIYVDVKTGTTTNIARGFYYNNIFYKDAAYTEELEKNINNFYIDIPTLDVYTYNGTSIGFVKLVREASETVKGIMKLYKFTGSNEDGTMTQKAICETIDTKIIAAKIDGGEVA